MHLSDVISAAETGGLDYSPANLRKVLGALRRSTTIYDAPADRIPADPELFLKRWGKGRVATYPIAHFDGADQFATWRSNVRGAIGRFSGATAAGAARRVAEDGWAEVLTAFDRVADTSRGCGLFSPKRRIGLEKLADCGRREGLQPREITLADAIRFAAIHCVTSNQKTALWKGAGLLDEMRVIPGLGDLLPAAPLGARPKARLANGERLAAMRETFRAAWRQWRDGYQAGTPSALSGSRERKSDDYMGQFDASLAWLLETVADLELADPATFDDPRALASPEWINLAARSVADAYDEDGEALDDESDPRLALRSLKTYLERLRTFFGSLGCDVATAAISLLLEDPVLNDLDGMTPENIEFCRAIVTSPSRQAVLFGMPWAMQARSQALLDRWDDLNERERYDAIRAGACAVAMLLLTRCAPIRVANLAAITFRGKKRWLSAPPKAGLALLVIPGSFVKNRKEIRARLRNAGHRKSWALVSWYLEHVRPRMVQAGGLPDAVAKGPALFPGTTGSILRGTLRDWIKLETAACGLPMRPHQARHALASILLNRHPEKLAQIAALLGDKVSTVERVYAWLDREKLMEDAQAMIPTAAAVLREARHV